MIRFVGNTADGLPQKRNQSLRACDSCRKRKKRCIHDISAGDASVVRHGTSANATSIGLAAPQLLSPSRHYLSSPSGAEVSPQSNGGLRSSQIIMADDEESDSDSDSGNQDRFIGDLNPESIFLAATTPETSLSPGDDHVGIWISRKALEEFRRRTSTNSTAKVPNADPLLSNILLPYMQRQCQQLLPPADHYTVLHQVYLQEIHPLFPVLDLKNLDLMAGDKSGNALVIKQTISLAASASPRVQGHLLLPNRNGEYVETDAGHFANQLASTIRISIDMGFVKDHVVIIQALAILALFTPFSHQSMTSAEVTARAISHAQTLGLHLDVPSVRSKHEYLARLFCCVWAIDKLNAAFQGRPTMLHEHDFGRDLGETISQQEGGFRLLLKVISLLDATISLYRPSGAGSRATIIEIGSFEDLIHDSDATKVSSNHLATIELLYDAVTILSRRSETSAQSNGPLDVRETMSAMNIVSVVGTEFREQISHMPFAPYALSLSLRVFYRELRFSSRSPFTRTRARRRLLNTCQLLRELFAETFPAAMKVADLAEQTVKEMDKVYNSILQQYGRSRSNSAGVDHGQVDHSSDAAQTRPPPPHLDSVPLDTSALDGLPDLDVFEFFNADFHLDQIDAALVDNTAPALSYLVDDQSFVPNAGYTATG